MSRTYEVEIQIVKSEIYLVKAKDDADLIRECSFSSLQKQSSNVKYIKTDDEFRKIGSWKQVDAKK